jgi:flagellar hook-associated protein 1 FlgK
LTSIQGLSTSPDSQSARIGAVAAAQALAQQLNSTTQGIQNLRANAETGINDSVITANNAMAQIAAINVQLQNNGQTDASTASLLDQRDVYIDQLSQLMDIRTVTNNLNQVTVFTNSGVQLVGTEASKLSFNPQGTMTPGAGASADRSVCRLDVECVVGQDDGRRRGAGIGRAAGRFRYRRGGTAAR